jgi:arylsulfatase A-like enzyme
MLKDHQYQNHLVGKWHVGMFTPDYTPVNRGFQTFLGMYLGSGDYYQHRNGRAFDFRLNYREENGTIVDKMLTSFVNVHSTEIYTNRTIDLLDQHVDKYGTGNEKPLFVYLSYQTPHGPYMVPDRCKEKLPEFFKDKSNPTQIYAGMVTCMDEGIGRIHSRLKELNMMENTLIVFTSDNGALMSGPGNNYPLRGGKKDYYEGGIRALAWVHSPLLRKTGYVNKHLHHISDWYPTFEYLVSGVDKRKFKKKKNVNAHVDGVNIWDSISRDKPCRDSVSKYVN